MRKPPRTPLKPGTLLQDGWTIVDARGIVRTLPSKPKQNRTVQERKNRVLNGIKRKIAAQHAINVQKRIRIPKELPLRTLVEMLKSLGFKEVGHGRTTKRVFQRGREKISLSGGALSTPIHFAHNPDLQNIYRQWALKKK